MEDKLAYLKDIFWKAMKAGLCSNQKEFAEIMGINRTVLSSAMNGNPKALTKKFIAKVHIFAIDNGLEKDATMQEPERPARQITIPEETLELYTNLSETCRNLSAILARIGVPTNVPDFPPVQKNSHLDER